MKFVTVENLFLRMKSTTNGGIDSAEPTEEGRRDRVTRPVWKLGTDSVKLFEPFK